MAQPNTDRGHWSFRWMFMLAAIGSAVGLGNIWKFPYITGENGGGAFVIVYLICIALIGIPVLIAEILIGKRAGENPDDAMGKLAKESNRSTKWYFAGTLAILTGVFLLSFYCVIGGWSFAYVSYGLSGMFSANTSVDMLTDTFNRLLENPLRCLAWNTVFVAATFVIISRGIRAGLERALQWMMPCLLLIVIILFVNVVLYYPFMEGIKFLFTPNFSDLTWDSVLVAMGHAFFTLSLATGAIMTYGSYMTESTSVLKAAFIVGAADTVIAIVFGLIIFPLVFAYDLSPGEGPGLVFLTLPTAFTQMAGGQFLGILFFILLALTALTSSISLAEPAVDWLMKHERINRTRATLIAAAAVWLLGIGSVLSFSLWQDYKLFEAWTFFDAMDLTVSNIMLPMGGILLAIFAGWKMKKSDLCAELKLPHNHWFMTLWLFSLRYIVPISIIFVMLEAFFDFV